MKKLIVLLSLCLISSIGFACFGGDCEWKGETNKQKNISKKIEKLSATQRR